MINIDLVNNKKKKMHQNINHYCFSICGNKFFIKDDKLYLYTKDKYIYMQKVLMSTVIIIN